jgi:hypothetical protein
MSQMATIILGSIGAFLNLCPFCGSDRIYEYEDGTVECEDCNGVWG